MNNQIQLVLKSSTTEMSLNDHETGIYLVPELDGLTGLPEIRTTSGVNAGYDGGWTSAQNYDARSITIRGVIANKDVSIVESMRKQLVSLAGQGKKEELTLDLVTEAGNAYTLQVRTIALEMAMQSVLEQQEYMLQLRADDPLIYDNTESHHEAIVNIAKAVGGFRIDFELPLAIDGGSEETVVNNNGLEEVPTIVKMYGSLHNPKIINHTTNQAMQVEANLGYAEGEPYGPQAVTGKNIEITDAVAAPLESVEIKGETSQNGTPTPDAPAAVQTVTGENVVKICGKNLFDKNAGNIMNAYIDAATTTITANDLNRLIWIPCYPNTTYTISAMASNWRRVVAWTEQEPAVGVQSYGIVNTMLNNVTTVSITTGATAKYIIFRLWHQNNSTETLQQALDNLQIELGSTATAYEPYQGQSYEVDLYEKNGYVPDTTTSSNGVSVSYADGTATVSKSSSSVGSAFLRCDLDAPITVRKGEQFTIFANNPVAIGATESSSPYMSVRLNTGSSDDATTDVLLGTVNAHATFTATADITYTRMTIRVASSLSPSNFVLKPIVKNTPIELCKIGNYQDYIYKSDGKWYVRKGTGKYVYNNDLGTNGISATRVDMLTPALPVAPNTPTQNIAISNMYGSTITSNTGLGGTTASSLIRVMTSTSIADSYDAVRALAAANNLTIYYALATPTDTEITNSALIEQLDNLASAALYSGVNNIFTVTPNEVPTLGIGYYTKKNPDRRDEIIIDSRLRTITLNGLDIYDKKTDGSEFPMLAPGENRISLQSDITGDNGYAEVSYKQGYLSI